MLNVLFKYFPHFILSKNLKKDDKRKTSPGVIKMKNIKFSPVEDNVSPPNFQAIKDIALYAMIESRMKGVDLKD